MSTKHFESARDAEIKRLKTELAKNDTVGDEVMGLRIKIVDLQKENAALRELVDGAEDVVESMRESPAQIAWARAWLERAMAIRKEAENE